MSLENPNIVEKAKYQDLALFGLCRIVFMKKISKPWNMEKTSQTKNSKQHDRLYIVKSTLIYLYVFSELLG